MVTYSYSLHTCIFRSIVDSSLFCLDSMGYCGILLGSSGFLSVKRRQNYRDHMRSPYSVTHSSKRLASGKRLPNKNMDNHNVENG